MYEELFQQGDISLRLNEKGFLVNFYLRNQKNVPFYDIGKLDFQSHSVLGHSIIYITFSWQNYNQQRLLDPVMDHYSHRD